MRKSNLISTAASLAFAISALCVAAPAFAGPESRDDDNPEQNRGGRGGHTEHARPAPSNNAPSAPRYSAPSNPPVQSQPMRQESQRREYSQPARQETPQVNLQRNWGQTPENTQNNGGDYSRRGRGTDHQYRAPSSPSVPYSPPVATTPAPSENRQSNPAWSQRTPYNGANSQQNQHHGQNNNYYNNGNNAQYHRNSPPNYNNNQNHDNRRTETRNYGRDHNSRAKSNWSFGQTYNWDYSPNNGWKSYNQPRYSGSYNYNNSSRFDFGRHSGHNFMGPYGNWSRWDNNWGDANSWARRWGFDRYDPYRGWYRNNIWYSHPSQWSGWGGWFSFFLSSSNAWGFSYDNYSNFDYYDDYYQYGDNCIRLSTREYYQNRAAVISFVACQSDWGNWIEVPQTRQFEYWEY